jgi:hypothetical protein
MYSLRQSAAMCWGKLRRAFLVAFRKRRVLEKLERRRGACTRCGACCKILFQCPAYDDSDGNPKCLIYNDRPGVCGLFPLDEKDLRDRNIVMPERKCGFYFEAPPAGGNGRASGNGNGHRERAEAMPAPVRWGPTRPNGKPKLFKGTFAILFSYFHKPHGTGNGNGNGNGNGRHGNGKP